MPFEEKDVKKELVTINNTVLDEINDEVPMMLLSASMHTLYLNTKALHYVYDHNPKIQTQYDHSVDKYIGDTKGTATGRFADDSCITDCKTADHCNEPAD
jgi:predicted amidohydrolase YtcJ